MGFSDVRAQWRKRAAGQTYFHATPAKNVPSILKNGLEARRADESSRPGVYGFERADWAGSYGGNRDVIIEFTPTEILRRSNGYIVSAAVPPENIVRVLDWNHLLVTSAIGDQDPGYKAVCALVRGWQQGEGPTADDVANKALEVAGGDETQARDLMRRALDWWRYMQSYVDRNGNPLTRAAALVDAYSDFGEDGNKTHITLEERGTIPTKLLATMLGAEGEKPGQHRNKQGQQWEDFKKDIATHGILEPIFITVDWNERPMLSEGNHRRDAAIELGLPEVPVQIRYFGNAQKQGRVLDRLQRNEPWGSRVAATEMVTMYHGTDATNLDSIREQGIKAGPYTGGWGRSDLYPEGVVYLATTAKDAADWTWDDKRNVIEVRVSKDRVHKMSGGDRSWRFHEGPIPPEQIVNIRTASKEISGESAGIRPTSDVGVSITTAAAKWVFDVDYSTDKDTLKAGEVVSGTRRVTVEADGYTDARLAADQMVAATGNEPTDARLVV